MSQTHEPLTFDTRTSGTRTSDTRPSGRVHPPGTPGTSSNSATSLTGVVTRVLADLGDRRSASVVGMPGTGKTSVIRQVFTQLRERTDPDNVLVLTPSRDHANALRDELDPGTRTSAAARSVHSYAFGLVSAYTATSTGMPALFVSGADQDARLADLIKGYTPQPNKPSWPAFDNPELRLTSGFRSQLRDAISDLWGNDFPTGDVKRLAQQCGRPEWFVLADLCQRYEDVLSLHGPGLVDTAAVFTKAKHIIAETTASPGSTWEFSKERLPQYILLDAVEDFPDAALGMLAQLHAAGVRFVTAACPEAATQSFRGATGLVFHNRDQLGVAEDLVLDPLAPGTRGGGAVCTAVAELVRSSGLKTNALGHVPAYGSAAGNSRVFTTTVRSQPAAARLIASMIYDRHQDGVPFSHIAVLTRRGSTAAQLSTELDAAGIPVDTQPSALNADPATAPLLHLLTLDPQLDDRGEAAYSILVGVYGGVDALALRRLERDLVSKSKLNASMPALLAWALDRDELFPEAIARVKRMVNAAQAAQSKPARHAVWDLWEAAEVAEPWRHQALSDPAGEHAHYLDSVIRLLALAEKLDEATSGDSITGRDFALRVMSQAFAQDSLAKLGLRDVVTVTTPAGAAHTDFDTVIVTDLGQDVWPNPKVRGSIFKAPQLLRVLRDPGTLSELSEPDFATRDYIARRKDTIRDETKLFVAALSRARTQAIAVAVSGGDENPGPLFQMLSQMEEVEPYRARTQLSASELSSGVSHEGHVVDVVTTPHTLSEIAGLARRRLESAVTEANEPMVTAWSRLLNVLARLAVPGADARTWWQPLSTDSAVLSPEHTVRISPSHVETFATCPLKWFLQQHLTQTTETYAQQFGTIIHQVAERFPNGGLKDMQAYFTELFADIEFDSEWEREWRQREGEATIDKLNAYMRHPASALSNSKDPVAVSADSPYGVELRIRAQLDVEHGPVVVGGRIDRLETIDDDAVMVVDFKTGKTVMTKSQVVSNPQLGTYQLALTQPDAVLTDSSGQQLPVLPVVGAALVYPRQDGASITTRIQPAIESDDGDAENSPQADESLRGSVIATITSLAQSMRSNTFVARPSPQNCRNCVVAQSCPAIVDTGDENS